jgi:aldehyde dehydrogenase (NAD+)
MGMPIGSSRLHNAVSPCAILRYYANLARAMDTEETRTAVSFAGRTVVRREPAGVAAVIASWNSRITLAFSQLAPALAAGCTIVLKPAAATSLSAFILAEAFEAADFPPGVFNLVTGTHQTAGALARHPVLAVGRPRLERHRQRLRARGDGPLPDLEVGLPADGALRVSAPVADPQHR